MGSCTVVFVVALIAFGAAYILASSSYFLNTVFLLLRVLLLAFSMALCTFLLVSSVMGLVLLKRRGVSREALLGLEKMLGVSVALFVATVYRSTTRIMTTAAGWSLPEWFEYGVGDIVFYLVTFAALLFFIFSALRSKYIASQARDSAMEMSQKLLSDEGSEIEDNVPKAYVI